MSDENAQAVQAAQAFVPKLRKLPKPLGSLTIGEWTYTFAYDENNFQRIYSPQGSCTMRELGRSNAAMLMLGFPPVCRSSHDLFVLRRHLGTCARFCFTVPYERAEAPLAS